MTFTPQEARQYAQEFLDARLPGTKVEEGADTFYGYYTIHVTRDGKVYGMLGVNGYTGLGMVPRVAREVRSDEGSGGDEVKGDRK